MIAITYGQDESITQWVEERIVHVGQEGFGPSSAVGIKKDGYLIASIVYHRYQMPLGLKRMDI